MTPTRQQRLEQQLGRDLSLYFRRSVVNTSPYRTPGGSVAEHVLKAELALGKRLPPTVDVHHINDLPGDNRNVNLLLCPTRQYHILLHHRMWKRDVPTLFRPPPDPPWISSRDLLLFMDIDVPTIHRLMFHKLLPGRPVGLFRWMLSPDEYADLQARFTDKAKEVL